MTALHDNIPVEMERGARFGRANKELDLGWDDTRRVRVEHSCLSHAKYA
jgi:hypothetical protein